jgi:hypothetical protein
MIKNTTPYIGKLRLKFEKFPEYTGKSKLNKIHLDLGFTKLVSRVTPVRTTAGWVINPQCKYRSMINNRFNVVYHLLYTVFCAVG